MKRMLHVCIFVIIPLWGMNVTQLVKNLSSHTSLFDIKSFSHCLKEVVQQREQSGYAGRFVVKLTPYPESTFVVWGPLKGAYASLVRTLSTLHELGLISHELRFVKSDTYFVFNGDALGNSETCLDTFMLILLLMKNNPHKVFYLKGEVERELQSQNNDVLKKALQEKLSAFPELKTSLEKHISSFFNTLPLALYLTGLDPHEGMLRISYFSRTSREIDETSCGHLLTSPLLNVPQVCPIAVHQKHPVQVKATISSEQRLMSYQQHPGLLLVEPDKGSVTWNIFSGPSSTYQREYQFFKDAFTLLKISRSLENSILELYSADIRTKEPFRLIGSYYLMTGIKKNPQKTTSKQSDPRALNESILSLYNDIESLTAQATLLTELLETKEGGQ